MTIFYAILLFGFLIVIHELGHFAVAKLSGVQVNEFSVFMGPCLWQKQFGETMYSLRLIPLGGYCALEGEDDVSENPRAFAAAARWKRICILLAGAAMNFLAGLLMMVIVCLPMEQAVIPVISSFEEYATVDDGQFLQVGDRILEVDGEKIYVQSDFSMILGLNPGDVHDLVVERSGEKIGISSLYMERHAVPQADGSTRMMFGMNFTIQEMTFLDKLGYAWNQSLNFVRLVRLSIQMLFTGQAGIQDLSGPVGVVQQMSMVAQAAPTWIDALFNLLYFGGFIAINLAVMNLLPIPGLDGGRVAALLITAAIETLTRKPVNPKYENFLNGLGMILLLGLMAVIMFKDIFVLIRG